MKIQANGVDDFIKKFDDKTKGFVIYGPDEGLVLIRKNEILKKILPDYKTSLSLTTINPSVLKDKPNTISNEYNSVSLFGENKKVILIEDAENSTSKLLEEIFSKPQNNDNFIIITAGDLDSKSSLKRFAEYNQYFASIPCYKDDIISITKIINEKLRKENFKYNTEIINLLAESFGGNRLIILSELDKLIAYKGEDKNITIENVKACIQDNSEANINDFVNDLASLNIEKAYKELQNLYSEGVFPVAVIRIAISYFMKLQLYKYQIKSGISYDEITTRDNIFWKQRPIIRQHLTKLSLNNINNILEMLLNEECKMKGYQS